jgi:hypothetical protein
MSLILEVSLKGEFQWRIRSACAPRIRTREIPGVIKIDVVLFCSQYLWKDVVKMEGNLADLTHKFTDVNAAARERGARS